jgi:hypothetical protein
VLTEIWLTPAAPGREGLVSANCVAHWECAALARTPALLLPSQASISSESTENLLRNGRDARAAWRTSKPGYRILLAMRQATPADDLAL